MAARKPIVLGADGEYQQLQPSDTLGLGNTYNAKFTASTTLPAVTVAAGGALVLTVSPVTAGDSLAAGEDITVQPTSDLPAGLNIAWWRVSDANTVRVGLSATVSIGLGTTIIGWRVTAHR